MNRTAPTRQLLRVRAVVDAHGVRHAPGAMLLGADCTGVTTAPRSAEEGEPGVGWELLAVGSIGEVEGHQAAAGATRRDLPNSLLIPGLVNAHCHLDLTEVGPRPYDPAVGFVGWLDVVRRSRPTDAEGIRRAVARGIELSLLGGTVAVGDIAGAPGGRPNLEAWRVLRESALAGVSFLEFFGIGKGRERGREAVRLALDEAERDGARADGQMRLGLQPHAPNSVDRRLYEWAAAEATARGMPLATHLAETREERQFVAEGVGPQREFLEALGLWDESVLECVGRGQHPVRHLAPVLAAARFLVAHVNDAARREESDGGDVIEVLARTGTSVAYCPRASAYFGAPERLGPHRYLSMLAAGVNVALGTDSIINLPIEAARERGISVLDEMRLLSRRDGTDAITLLRMATTNGARALGLDPGEFRFRVPGRLAGLVAVDLGGEAARSAEGVLEAALRSEAPARLIRSSGEMCDAAMPRG
ncbi:MAG: amidohydrolase family protein [Phycisphaerales bacterium]